MDHDDRIGMRLLRRNAELDVHLVNDVRVAVCRTQFATDVEKAVARQRIGRVVVGTCRRGEGRGEDCECDH